MDEASGRPLHLGTIKSSVGHTEPAAGALGMLRLLDELDNRREVSLLHMISMNTYVTSALDSCPGDSHIPRSHTSLPQKCTSERVGGVSSFAFMGTNAHALLSGGACIASVSEVRTWQEHRFWPTMQYRMFAEQFSTNAVENEICISCELKTLRMSFLWDHVVLGRSIMPGAAFFEMAACSSWELSQGHGQHALVGISIPAPLVLESTSQSITVFASSCPQTGTVSIQSSVSASKTQSHLRGRITRLIGPSHTTAHTSESTREQNPVSVSSAYSSMATSGLQYQKAFQVLRRVRVGAVQESNSIVFASGEASVDMEPGDRGWMLHPAIVDGSMQLGAAAGASMRTSSSESDSKVPAGVGAYEILGISNAYMFYVNACLGTSQSITSSISSYEMIGYDGRSVGKIFELESRSMKRDPIIPVTHASSILRDVSKLVYAKAWYAQSQGASDRFSLQASHKEDFFKMSGRMSSERAYNVSIREKDSSMSISTIMSLIRSATTPSSSISHTCSISYFQAALDAGKAKGEQITSALTTVLRCAASEYPTHNITIVGCNSNASRMICSDTSDMEVRLSCGFELVEQLHRSHCRNVSHFQLMPIPRGSLDSLQPVRSDAYFVEDTSQLLIAVHAVGLNFRDVLNVLDMYPGDPGPPGGDFSGVVVNTPPSLPLNSILGIGVSVFGLASGCLGTHTVTSVDATAPVPGQLSHSEASTLPTVYVTVELALRWSAGSCPGEHVLVHAATGGVGMAATSVIASMHGTVLGSAGGSLKRHQIRQYGVHSAIGSRDTAFVSETPQLIGSCGVGIVLNSLTSPGFVAGSLSTLGSGGRFVEIGKRDIWSVIRTQSERRDVSFGMVALDFAPPRVISGALMGVSAAIDAGALSPLRSTCWSIGETQLAMRIMAQARHMGKVVVRVSSSSVRQLQRDCGIAVTGGFGALGCTIARWMAERSAGMIGLLGRSGRSSGDALRWVFDSSCNTVIVMQRCDVSSVEETRSVFSIRSHSGHDVMFQGVMHAGGVLQDAVLDNQTAGRVRSVFAPKVDGLSRIEHQVTGSIPMRMFTLFSSIAALLGSGGQSNYAAANATLDSRSEMQSRSGIPSTSVQWGAWLGGGMASESVRARLDRIGVGVLIPDAALRSLFWVLQRKALSYCLDRSVVLINNFNLKVFLKQNCR